MGKDAKSDKAGRNKGDDLAKHRTTQRHRETFKTRQARERGAALIQRDLNISGLNSIALKLGAPQANVLHKPTPTRIKRDIIKFITDPMDNEKAQRNLRLRYGRMTVKQFITHINAKLGA